MHRVIRSILQHVTSHHAYDPARGTDFELYCLVYRNRCQKSLLTSKPLAGLLAHIIETDAERIPTEDNSANNERNRGSETHTAPPPAAARAATHLLRRFCDL